MNIKHLDNLLKQPMTRLEFLRAVGIAALIVLNLEGLIKFLTGRSIGLDDHPVSHGYGNSGYSGFVGRAPTHVKTKGYDS